MAKKYYSTKIVGVGKEVPKFIGVVKMLVLFDDSMVLPELRELSVLHSGNQLDDVIKVGDILKIADSEFKILKVGGDVHSNMDTLGHVIIKFDNGEGELMAGSIHVEDKPIPEIRIGDEISVSEAEDKPLAGKKFAVVGDGEVAKTLKEIFTGKGAVIAGEGDADILVTLK